MPQTIFLTGASGFIGQAIVRRLLLGNHRVRALIHHSPLPIAHPNLQPVAGDLFDGKFLLHALGGCDAIIHLIGIIRQKPSHGITFHRLHEQATASMVQAANEAQIPRFIHMSALGTRPVAACDYHRTKYNAEQIVCHSQLKWTVFRPSLIHGPQGEFMRQVAGWARKTTPPFLFMPYFGAGLFGQKGAGLLQPIFVEDVARAFVEALENEKTIGEIHPLAGPDRYTWPQFYRLASQAIVGHPRLTSPIPAWFAKFLTHAIPAPLLPFNRDQIIMSQEDNVARLDKFIAQFGWTPAPFPSSLQSYCLTL
ncbi:MAG: NAD(P)H-binding protein [Phycisphaerales bacterium]|nr:NAD(P)H-binding protein [Phycisphaerales bacterium]